MVCISSAAHATAGGAYCTRFAALAAPSETVDTRLLHVDISGPVDTASKRALRAVDRSFYRQHAGAFSATRTRPWSAFEPIVRAAPHPMRVLDAGCGNGRFAHALAKSAGAGAVSAYVGVDESGPLLAEATLQSFPFPSHFVEADLLDLEPPWGAGGAFDLAVCLGVLHHVPGTTDRLGLAARLLASLANGGVLALSFFRYERSPRIRRRLVDPREVLADGNRLCLDAGDYLMPFGETGGLRYCHMFNDDEIDGMAALPGAEVVARFSPETGSDKLNEYLLLRRVPGGVAGR